MTQKITPEMDPNVLEVTVEESHLEGIQTYGPQDNLALTLDYLKIQALDGLDFAKDAFEYIRELRRNGQKIYRREVEGENGKGFIQLKFRTMKIGADKRVNSPTYQGELEASGKPKGFEEDILGRASKYMRKACDELPQFLNIAMRHMNLVGPRPLTSGEEKGFPKHYNEKRKLIKPGLAGASYIFFDDPIPEERIAGDLKFIDLQLEHPIASQVIGTAVIAYKLATKRIKNG